MEEEEEVEGGEVDTAEIFPPLSLLASGLSVVF